MKTSTTGKPLSLLKFSSSLAPDPLATPTKFGENEQAEQSEEIARLQTRLKELEKKVANQQKAFLLYQQDVEESMLHLARVLFRFSLLAKGTRERIDRYVNLGPLRIGRYLRKKVLGI